MTLTLCTLVYWDNLVRDIVRWIDSCRTCQSRSKRGRLSAVLKSISQVRPHATLIFDLTFITPQRCHGGVGAISAICVTTKLTWFRPIWGRSANDAAWGLFATVMDSGVVPLKILSDGDSAFRSEIVLEFTTLMGIRQGFSLAWSPESHGLVEREHFELVKDTGRALEIMVETKLDQWP